MQKIINHRVLGDILYTKRKQSKTIRVSISPSKGVRVSLPFICTYSKAVEFINLNETRILTILNKQASKPKISVSSTSKEEIRSKAKQVLPVRLNELASYCNSKITMRNMFGLKISEPFKFNRLTIKNNKSNWGSCSAKKNINLNMNLVELPQELMDYVIIHELCHLIHLNHSDKFHSLLDQLCNGKSKELSKSLRKYSLR